MDIDFQTLDPDIRYEFEKAGFTPVPTTRVKHPMIKESPASFECLLRQRTELGPGFQLPGPQLCATRDDGVVVAYGPERLAP